MILLTVKKPATNIAKTTKEILEASTSISKVTQEGMMIESSLPESTVHMTSTQTHHSIIHSTLCSKSVDQVGKL